MRTNIDIDDQLMKKAMEAGSATTKKGIVEEALQMLVNSKAREKLRELRGKVQFWDDYDYKAMRQNTPAKTTSTKPQKAVRQLEAKRVSRRSAA